MSKTRLMTVATVALAGVLLSGCGSLSPGVAVKVGAAELSVRDVDATATKMCAAWEDQNEGQTQALPMAAIRQWVVQALTLRSWAMQLGEGQDVKPGKSYLTELAQTKRVAANVPADSQDAYLDVVTVNALVLDIVDQIGRKSLTEAGVAEPTTDEVRQAGLDLFSQWPNAHEIEFDPRYGLTMVDGVITATDTDSEAEDDTEIKIDTDTSVAVGDLATSARAEEPSPDYVESLPAAHRCG